MTPSDVPAPQPLAGVQVLDLSRILAGPWCSQTLADLGADVIKVERPGSGDDTRGWGPPFLKASDGRDTAEAAYYLGANRNKRSVTIDIAKPAGQALVRQMASRADVFNENFKVGVTQPVTGKGTKAQAEYRFNQRVSARAQWDNQNQNSTVGNPGVELRFRFEWE